MRHVKTKVSKKKLYRLTRLVFYISLFHSNMLQETFLLYCPLSLFHPTSLMFGRESFGWWRSESWSPSPPPIVSISTDRLDLHRSTRSPLCFAKTFVATAKRDACPTGRETAQWKRDSAGSLTMLMLYILRHNLSTKQISNQNNENKK